MKYIVNEALNDRSRNGSGVGAGRNGTAGRRLVRRLLSLVLALNLLFNSQAFAAIDGDGRYADVEYAIPGSSDFAPGAEDEAGVYLLDDQDAVHLSALAAELHLPVAMKDITSVTALDDGAQVLKINKAAESDDYTITLSDPASEGLISIAARDGSACVVRLLGSMAPHPDAEEVGDILLDGDEAEEPDDVFYTCDLAGAGRVRLSAILAAVGLDLSAGAVESIGLMGMEDGALEPLFIERDGSDFALTVSDDFSEAWIVAYTRSDACTIRLLNGRAEAEEGDAEQTSEPPIEASEAPEATAEPYVEELGEIDLAEADGVDSADIDEDEPAEAEGVDSEDIVADEPAEADEEALADIDEEMPEEIDGIDLAGPTANAAGWADRLDELISIGPDADGDVTAAACETDHLRLTLSGPASASAVLRFVKPETNGRSEVLEAYEIEYSDDCDAIAATLTDVPELMEGEYLTLYGIRDGALNGGAVAGPLDAGAGFIFDAKNWNGFALVRESEAVYQALAPVDVDDAVIELRGALPVGAAIDASAASEYATDDTLVACEIGLQDVRGNELQLSGDETVQVTLRSEAIREALDAGSAIQVNQYAGDGSVDVVEIISAGEDEITFEAPAMAVFTVDEVKLHTYVFYAWSDDAGGYQEYAMTDDQGRSVTRQVVKDMSELVVPQLSSTENRVFAGWHEGDIEDGNVILEPELYDFDHVTIDDSREIHLYAAYHRFINVTFHDQYDAATRRFPVAYTRRASVNGETARVKVSDMRVAYVADDGAEMAFYGWSLTPVSVPGADVDDDGEPVSAVTPGDDGCIEVNDSVELYPLFKGIHWLTYYTAQSGLGASYVAPAAYYTGDDVRTPLMVPTREGYIFQGWYTGTLTTDTVDGETVETVNYGSRITDAEGALTGASDGGLYVDAGKLYLRSDATLYARWSATWHIVIWKQRASDAPGLDDADKHYDYDGTVRLSAEIGDTVTVPAEYKTTRVPEGYVFNENLSNAAKVIGNTRELTALNIYYDLVEPVQPGEGAFTLTFMDSVAGDGESAMPAAVENIAYGDALAGYIPDAPVSARVSDAGKAIYAFDQWYLDADCTIPADLDGMTMPPRDLTVYAGWEPIRFRVDIDPNYGALYTVDGSGRLTGTGATYFNSTYDAEPIGEYTHVTRDYVESSSGSYYYVNHDRAFNGRDRYTYYTDDPGLATEDTTFEYAPGVYSYAGWYEVYLDEDGNEIGEASEPYDFTRHTDHDTKLRLHWKKSGTYYLAFFAGEGTLEDGAAEVVLPEGYSDSADLLLDRAAVAPAGYVFRGWQVRGADSGRIYAPGQTLILRADDAIRFGGRDIVFLDAVYTRLNTATLIYDANGGSIDENPDFGYVDGEPVSGTVEGETATVAGLINNTAFTLSDGTGFSYAPFTLAGWSNVEAYDPDDGDAQLYELGGECGVDSAEPMTVYAAWQTTVTYDLNHENAEWGDGGEETNARTVDQWLNIPATEPEAVPTSTDGKVFLYWSADDENPYDFAQPVTGALELRAVWSDPIELNVMAVDATDAALADKTGEWTTDNIAVGADEIALTADSHVSAPEGYVFAFAALHEAGAALDDISEADAVTAVRYDAAQRSVCVRYADSDSFAPIGDDREIAFVYYNRKTLNLSFMAMDTQGRLNAIEGLADIQTEALGECDVAALAATPLADAGEDYSLFAFAIGGADADSANGLSLITGVSDSDESRPALRLRNTWRGFEYTTDGNSWSGCGFEPALYVIYYTQVPTVVQFTERTRAVADLMDAEFTYNYVIRQTDTTVTSVQKQILGEDGEWTDDGEPEEETASEETVVHDTEAAGTPCVLTDGESNSNILFCGMTVTKTEGEPQTDGEGDPAVTRRSVTTVTVTSAQSVTITQTADERFDTDVDGEAGYVYTYTADGSTDTRAVTFTNTHKSTPIEIHVALVQEEGIVCRDDLRAEAGYSFDLAPGDEAALLEAVPAESLFTGDANVYAFGAAIFGTGADGEAVEVNGMGASSIAYSQDEQTGAWALALTDESGKALGELGEGAIYYLYYPMPRLRYVKRGDDGSLTDIAGSVYDAVTGEPVESDDITYSHRALTMNGETMTQDQGVEIPAEGFVISQTGNHFRMPPILDDGLFERYLGYAMIGAGDGGAENIDALDASDGLNLQLAVRDNALQYSFDGRAWKNLPLSGVPTIYAVYTERGYDLQISKAVDISKSGDDALFTGKTFTVTLTSNAITRESYDADGAESGTIEATPASGGNPGRIVLTVKDGTRIRIRGLGRGEYTLRETNKDNYILTAGEGGIADKTVRPATVTDDALTLTLEAGRRIELTNSPKAICKIVDDGTEHIFYTISSAVDYVAENIPTYTATIQMLTDYVMPVEDVVKIPSGFNVTLVTAEEGFEGAGSLAVITRTRALLNTAMFTNRGQLTFRNMVLDGASIEADAPMIESAGNLTVDMGAVLENAINIRSGGAIHATAGDITVNGNITGCAAGAGGAICHDGNATITVSGTARIQNNTATGGNGGAISLYSGSIAVSGISTLSGNRAENGRGGAIYAGSAVIDIDQNSTLRNNRAKSGGAICAETATVTISATEGFTPPEITHNTATEGDGGAIYVGAGAVTVSGGSVSNNGAASGKGGAICTDSATATISDEAEVNANRAAEGGAVYAARGAVSVSGGIVSENTATTGNGGAICAGSGNVTVSGGSVSENEAANGSGGAVYAQGGNVTVSGGSLTGNTARTDGGAVYAQSGAVNVRAQAETAPEISGNTATEGNGGAICAPSGAVSVEGVTVSENSAGSSGGAIYADKGVVTLTDAPMNQNTAGQNGGAVYALSGNVTVSGGSMSENSAEAGNGGAMYIGSGIATMSNANLTDNSAEAGRGGAVYMSSGTLTLNAVTATGNRAINGAAVFDNTGRVTFNNGSYTGNVASEGGAIGVGSVNARLVFNGDVQVKDNALGDGGDKSNVYLDQDDDAVINIDTLGTGAAIGIHVPDAVVDERSVPGARFAIYVNDTNAATAITNDRFPTLAVQSDTDAKKLYWGNSIKVTVRFLASYSGGFPPAVAGTQCYTNSAYFPDFNDGAISELAAELFNKYGSDKFNPKLSGTAVYAGAFLDGVTDFGEYLTKLTWDSESSKWMVTRRDGTRIPLQKAENDFHRIYIYYAEPAYISIENNTDMPLNISDMKVKDTSVINSDTVAGYGMVFAKNGAIRTALLPVTAEDLHLAAGASINLLIPGGRSMAYALEGSFDAGDGASVRLRRTNLAETSLTLGEGGAFEPLTGTTLNSSGTYQIIFGDDKHICKVVDADGVEHPYGRISDAINAVKSGTITLATAKTAVIEMLTDYLLPASDLVEIPQGYDITLTAAAKEGARYTYNGEGDRATISRDSENTQSMINSKNAKVGNTAGTTLRLNNLIFDGKSVRGNSDGGAVNSRYTNVYVDHVDFKNVYASNGGAMLIMFELNETNTKEARKTVPGTILDVRNTNFTGCTSTTTVTSNRLGGGAIVTNAETMTLDSCDFENCSAVDQAGAVFHRVDGNYNSWANITNCSFVNCNANAAGGLELDSKTITVEDCTFNHCVAKQRNGGGFNVFALNNANTGTDCWVTVRGCSFNDCQLPTTNANNGNGGGFRCNAVYTKVENCTFTNNLALYGGGFCISNSNAKKAEVYGCTFERNTANQGGGIFGKPLELIVGDYTYTDDEGVEHVRHTEIKNCTSANEGGGIYQIRDANGAKLTVTNAVITGNRTRNNGKNGGGIWTNARVTDISGAAITDNTCTSKGGGVYAYSYTSLSIADSDISRNVASSDGGGVWFDANNDENRAKQVLTIKGSAIDGNTSGASGGGVYTLAKTVSIQESETRTDSDGQAVRSSISNNTAKTNGGGIYQSRNVDGSIMTIRNADIDGNTSSNTNTGSDQGGGGVYAGVRTLNLTNASISGNKASSQGGGVLFEINNDGARNVMALTVEGCTLDGNTSGANGGGIYTRAKTVEIRGCAQGDDDEITPTTISNCTANYSGGGIYQNRDVEGSSLTIEDSVVSGCESKDASTDENPPRGGGGVFANVRTASVTGSEISGNRAVRNGGGIDFPKDGVDYMLTLDDCSITGNTADYRGGGVFTRAQLALRNGTAITGNRLSTNSAAECAGVYIKDGRTLFVGAQGATEPDSVSVKENYTANGGASNLRLWETNKENNSASAYVYCDLDGEIRVVNAAKVGTWFGSAENADPEGFTDTDPVFRADNNTLHGIIDRNDDSGKKIIWAGPPIAKITDGNGNLLYLKDNGTNPAIFDRLGYSSGNTNFSNSAAFNMLCTETPPLYTKEGELYTGKEYTIKMLDNYETGVEMNVNYYKDRTITFTTAGKGDTDGYPFIGSGTRATVTRGAIEANQTTLNAKGNLVIENIVIDGNSQNARSSRCMYIDNANCTVTLGRDAILQNGHISGGDRNGGGVSLNNGTFVINGGVIRNCKADNGGGVYQNNGTFRLEAGNILQCTASVNGGGVCQNSGAFTMTGGTIGGQDSSSRNQAANGGGVFVANGKHFTMSGGAIIHNAATAKGGGIAVGGNGAKIFFSGRVNVSGNTRSGSVATRGICNVELDHDSNGVINTNNGGLTAGASIGVYVPDGSGLYEAHGQEYDPFGTFAHGDKESTLYGFVNDRNGLKGGIIENPKPNTIYWIQIFSLKVSKAVEASASNPADSDSFDYEVIISGTSSTGQHAYEIDSSNEFIDYGEMRFERHGYDYTRSTFSLTDGQSITGMNLSKGLDYEVREKLTAEQQKKYAVLPAASYVSKIGENSDRRDVDPYVSALKFVNVLPVCKLTDNNGNLLYRKYVYSTNNTAKTFYVPAVYTELTGDFSVDADRAVPYGAFTALDKETFYQAVNGGAPAVNTNPPSYAVSNGVRIEMLIQNYTLREAVTLPASIGGAVTLTTAKGNASLFPYQSAGTTATIRRGFADESMFTVQGRLVLDNIILDGAKGSYAANVDGGIANVPSGGHLTIQNGAMLQNSRTTGKGGAVYAAAGAESTPAVTMTGGRIQKNESDGDGAGIYLEKGAKLALSGNPDFGGKGTDVGGNITNASGNLVSGALTGKTNGGKTYARKRQDIFLAEDDEAPASIVLTGNISGDAGSIWVWAGEEAHYAMMKPFALIDHGVTVNNATYAAFRNARPDDETHCEPDAYLTGSVGANKSWVYWTGGFTILLKKVDEDNHALPGATFQLFTDAALETHHQQNGEDVAAVSADGTNKYVDASGEKLKVGTVMFRKVPEGTFYLRETGFPAKDADGNAVTYVDNGAIYRLTVSADGTYILTLMDGTEEGQPVDKDEEDELYLIVNVQGMCKLTDDGDRLLYKDENHTQPAVYGTLEAGFAAAQGDLYDQSGNKVDVSADLKLKLLKDYTQPAPISQSGSRAVTLTTAETSVTSTMTAAGDSFIFETDRTEDKSRAVVTRGFDDRGSMLAVAGSVTMTNITLDGDNQYKSEGSGEQKGGIVRVSDGGALTVTTDAVLTRGAASEGGAVYVENGGAMTLNGGSIANNTGSGAGVYLEEGAALNLSGSPKFDGNTATIDGYADRENGGESAYADDKARQDIFLAGYADGEAASVTVTGALANPVTDGGDGWIWIWADQQAHCEMLTQFAKYTMDDIDDATLHAFRNAQDDDATGCGADYLTGQLGDAEKRIYWTGGFDFVFKKLDGNGDALNGAKFTLYVSEEDDDGKLIPAKDDDGRYVPYAKLTEAMVSKSVAEDSPVTIKVKNGDDTLTGRAVYGDGLVVFEKIPPATYFLAETEAPKLDPDDDTSDATWQAVEELYRLVLSPNGDFTLSVADDAAADGWAEAPKETLEFGEGDDAYTVDVFTALNESPLDRKVILRKVEEDSYSPIEGKSFTVYRADGQTVVSIKKADGTAAKLKNLVSKANGTIWVGRLPYGTYYMDETVDDATLRFEFRVDENGVSQLVGTEWTPARELNKSE